MTDETALYRYYDADGRLLYVGISYNPISRQSQHSSSSAWYRECDRMTAQWFATRFEALEAEAKAIRLENPIHNKARPEEPRPESASTMRQRNGRLGALTIHSQGKTNTGPARKAFLARFEREVDPDGVLDPDERARRAEYAKKAYFLRLITSRHARRRRHAS